MEYWNETTINAVSIGIDQLEMMSNNVYINIDYIIKDYSFDDIRMDCFIMMVVSLYISINIEISKFKYNLSIHQLKNPKRFIELYGYDIDDLKIYTDNIQHDILSKLDFRKKSNLTVDETDIDQKKIKEILEKTYDFKNSENSKLVEKISYALHKYPNDYTKKLKKIFTKYRYKFNFLNNHYIKKLKQFKYFKDKYTTFDMIDFEYRINQYMYLASKDIIRII